jgi:hypothetical protein
MQDKSFVFRVATSWPECPECTIRFYAKDGGIYWYRIDTSFGKCIAKRKIENDERCIKPLTITKGVIDRLSAKLIVHEVVSQAMQLPKIEDAATWRSWSVTRVYDIQPVRIDFDVREVKTDVPVVVKMP